MTTHKQRAVTLVTGVSAAAATMSTALVGLAVPADAVVAPTLNQATCTLPSVAPYNAAALVAYKRSPAFVALTRASAVALKKYKVAKKPAAKRAAKAAWLRAVARQNAALAAWARLSTYSVFSGVATPAGVTPTDQVAYPGTWRWGTYTTRVLIRGGKVVKVCSSVDETNAGNGTVLASDSDKTTSAETYQGISRPVTPADPNDIPGTLPVLWTAAASAPSTSAALVTAHVAKCVTDVYTLVSVACPDGGLAVGVGGLTGATYTVAGFTQSLQKALTTAKVAKKIG